jgi:glycosyltransferase involved in cell wall biosynthesis
VRGPELRLRLGRAARAEALSRWSWPRRVEEMERVYAELVV